VETPLFILAIFLGRFSRAVGGTRSAGPRVPDEFDPEGRYALRPYQEISHSEIRVC